LINELPQSPADRAKIVETSGRRYKRAQGLNEPFRQKWLRMHKIWAKMQDAVEEPESQDEPNTFLAYGFAVVEDLAAGVVDAYFKLQPPCKPRARRPGHEKPAENMGTMARNYYSGAPYQEGMIGSVKEWVITGNRWEFDEWAEEYAEGQKWGKEKRSTVLDKIKTLAGKVIGLEDEPVAGEHEVPVEVEHLYPLRVGYNTKFPTVFDVMPEDPNKRKLDDQAYIILEEVVTLADLKKQMYTDPASGEKVPVYDVTEIEALIKDGHKIKAENAWQGDGTDYKSEIQQRNTGADDETDGAGGEDDVNRVHLTHFFEKDRLRTVANGKYLIRAVSKHLHKPRFTFRLNVYTIDPYCLFGKGAIEPIEDELYELNDVHNLSMMEWLRGVHRMVAYTEGTVPYSDDWRPRAGGKVRVRTDLPIRDVMMPIDQSSQADSMFPMESNLRGLIELATARPDFSPGAEGTKQYHKTATGITEISSAMRTRQAMMLRMLLINASRQMESMEAFISQYQFDPAPYRQYRDDGSTLMVELSKDDVYTDGVGFDYVMEIDPAAGDDAIARQHSVYLIDLAIKYEAWRQGAGDPTIERANVAEMFRNTLRKFGHLDTSRLLTKPDGTMNPGDEFEIMMGGGIVKVNPKEDMIGHLLEHLLQRDSPAFQQAKAAGKVTPEGAQALELHIQETMAAIGATMQNPELAAQERLNEMLHMGMMKQGGQGAAPAPAPMGGGMAGGPGVPNA
jgi:hypothetical protein